MAKVAALSKRFFDHVHSGSFPWQARAFLCLAVLAAYASVWQNEFVLEDKQLIILNGLLKHWNNLPELLTSQTFAGSGLPEGFYRLLQMLIYFLIYQAFGFSTIAFHALNVTLQALNACLLHHFGIRAGFAKGAAFAAALLWAVHPLQTNDVAYMASTAELLWGCFCLLGLLTLLPDFAPRKIWQAMIFFMLALACKESAAVFPALAATTFLFASKKRAQLSAFLKMWPLWLLAAGYIAILLLFMHKPIDSLVDTDDHKFFQFYMSSPINRILTSLATLPVYVRLIVWPVGLHIERVFPVFTTLLPYPATGALMTGLGLWHSLRSWARFRLNKHSGEVRQGLALSFGLIWFAVALSPVTGVVSPSDTLISESWMYVPTMGLFLGVMQTAAGFFEKRQNAARLLVLVLALSSGALTFFQNEVWRNPETLYQNTLRNGGHVDRLSNHLGVFYMEQGEYDKAIEQFQDMLDDPDTGGSGSGGTNAHLQIALALLQVRTDISDTVSINEIDRTLPSCRHIPEAIGELGKALQEDPDFYWAHQALAVIYRYQGNNRMADFHQKQAEAILQKQGGH